MILHHGNFRQIVDCSIFNRFVVRFQIGSVKTAFPGAKWMMTANFQLSYGGFGGKISHQNELICDEECKFHRHFFQGIRRMRSDFSSTLIQPSIMAFTHTLWTNQRRVFLQLQALILLGSIGLIVYHCRKLGQNQASDIETGETIAMCSVGIGFELDEELIVADRFQRLDCSFFMGGKLRSISRAKL